MASDRRNRRPLSPYSSSNDRDKDKILPVPPATLTHGDIAQALLDSPDEGCTLDFSHKNLGDVGESGAEEIATIGAGGAGDECTVLRIALGYNRLTTLPMTFALLAKLRYLNLRSNSFTVFPDVLTVMPSLEILDISRNKLKRLPSQPGTLLGLRVFSISKNRLARLPEYISKATNLTVLQIDHNPLEWPPRHITERLDNAADSNSMLSCIENVKRWIEDHSSGSSMGKTHDFSRAPNGEPYRGIRSGKSFDSDLTSDESEAYANISLPRDITHSPLQHSRSYSTESDISNNSIVSQESSGPELPQKDKDSEASKILPLPPYSNVISSSLTSSPISPVFMDHNPAVAQDDYTPSAIHADDRLSASDGGFYGQQHSRNASYSVARGSNSLAAHLSAKKSLPDLRRSDMAVSDRSRHATHRPRLPGIPGKVPAGDSNEIDARNSKKPQAPAENRDAPLSNADAGQSHQYHLHNRTPRSQPANNHVRGPAATLAQSSPSPAMLSPRGAAPPMDVERNSYFRRLSTLPPSTVSSTMPEALMAMIDSARGIFFAVSQIYQSLRHYTVFAIDDRLSGLLGKVLDPASTYMAHLINALDRFDSVSRRGIPPPLVCRGVLESCRDNVAVFGKVVGVLHLQLKVLAGSDDARYSRSLLLMLYGSMAEISNSWQNMTPHLDSIQGLLSENRLPQSTAMSSKSHIVPALNTSAAAKSGIPSIPEGQPQMPSQMPRNPGIPHTNTNGRSRTTRRHAGSFSIWDVQLGKSLPSAIEEAPVPSLPSLSPVQPLRPALRKPTNTAQVAPSLPVPYSQSSSSDSPHSTHSRQGSSVPVIPSGTGSQYTQPYAQQSEASSSRSANTLEVPGDSSKMVDEDLLDTMEAATETASSVWRMMDEILHDTKETKSELLESLEYAQSITRRLKDGIRAMRRGTADSDRRTFWEDAHHFVKAVVNVSTILKAFSHSHPFSVVLRSNIAKLTQSTQDFAILLQVSSFSPAPTPGPYSPPIPPAGKPSTGISRARSAQATPTPSAAKPKLAELRETPWSALPHQQTFKIPENS